jgi:cardiolipin synthase
MTFLKDWFWATRRPLELEWTPASALPEGSREPVLVIPSGPSDPVETASLFVQHAINSATRRVWIASPYFVPDPGVQEALKLAVFRGVDVRILVPKRGDSTIIDLAGFAFYEDLLRTGVRIFRFREGFLHCKTMVVDDGAAAVGTVNLDNRSLRLNFEITALLFGADSVVELARQFEGDLAVSVELAVADVTNRSFPARLASQVVYLFAPVL